MATKFEVSAIFKAIDKFTGPVKKMEESTSKFTTATSRKINKLGGKFIGAGNKVAKFGLGAAAALTPVGFVLKDIISLGIDFEQAMVNATAKMNVQRGTAEYEKLQKVVMEVGRTTKFSASEAAEGLGFLAMAGFDASQSVEALPKMARFASAANADLASASDILTDALGALGMAADDPKILSQNMGRLSDVMVATTNKSNVNVHQLFETLKEFGPVAASLGVPLEDTVGMIGLLGNAGIKAGRAGTSLKNIMVKLTAPVGAGQKALEKLGIATKDADGNMRSIPDIVADIAKATKGMGKGQKGELLAQIFGTEALAPAMKLMDYGADKIKEFSKEIENSAGITEKLAYIQTQTLGGSLKAMNSQIEGVKLSIFNMNNGPLKEVVDQIRKWISANGELIGTKIGEFLQMIIDNLDNIILGLKIFVGFTASLYAVGAALKFISTVITLVEFASAALTGIMGLMSSTAVTTAATFIGAWIAAAAPFVIIGGLIAAIIVAIGELLGFDVLGWLSGLKDMAVGWLFDDDEEKKNDNLKKIGQEAQVVGSEERTASFMDQKETKEYKSILEIQDPKGRTKLSGNNPGISLMSTGGFQAK